MYPYFIPFLQPNNFPWYGNITVNILRLPYHFTEWYNQYYLKFLSIIYEWSSLSTCSPTFGIIIHFYFSPSDRYIKITYCGDNMHFSGVWWCWNILMCLFAICIWNICLGLLPISNCLFTLMCILRVFCMIYTCGLHYFPSQSIYWLFNLLKGLSQSKSFKIFDSVQFGQSLSHVWLFATLWITARQASLSITNSRSLLKLMSIKSVMPSSYLILCHPLLLLPPIPSSIRVLSNESTLHIRWPKYWNFSLSISPSNEHPGLISFRMDFD